MSQRTKGPDTMLQSKAVFSDITVSPGVPEAWMVASNIPARSAALSPAPPALLPLLTVPMLMRGTI